ncbi:hypothetical protein ACFO0U_11595 [Chromohalobacter sarecensis]|uniref:Uncharacterized protein n=1 Tax=Chromohalobacter sarecensis TaxID=245294 RepID=A0ABV9D1M2_9GAMM|nr:hypothetical protein [Chromohalobacter sarecensis]MCK0714459.1 hypothetical protein [Chromohalobacter sarecensis]
MRVDQDYLNKLTRPFATEYSLTVSQYFQRLDANNTPYEESEGKLSEKFLLHIEHLIDDGCIVGPNREQSGASQLGLKIGVNRHAIIVNDGWVKYIKPSKDGIVKPMVIWLRDHTLGAILSGLVIAIILAALNL